MRPLIFSLYVLGSLNASTLCAQEVTAPAVKVASDETVKSLADQLFSLIMSPASITLTIKDADTLSKAIESLEKNKKAITDIATKLESFEVPSDAEREAIDKSFTNRELELRDSVGKEFMEHLKAMPSELSSKWGEEMRGFYSSLDENQKVFKRYLSKDEDTETQEANKQE